jgi:hypothetical protein
MDAGSSDPKQPGVQVRKHLEDADGGGGGRVHSPIRNQDLSLKLETPEHQLQYVLDCLPEDGTLLEYGSGSSTVWFAERLKGRQRLVTIEHDEKWFFAVRNELVCMKQKQIARTTLRLCPPTNPKFNLLPYGHPGKEIPIGMSSYIWGKIDSDQETPIPDADVVFVDGVCRGACLSVVSQRAKDDAIVFLHDAERTWYSWATNLMIFMESIKSERRPSSQLLSRFRLRR